MIRGYGMRRRQLLLAAAGACAFAGASTAQDAPGAAGEWLMAISEGTSGTQSTLEVMARYEDFARVLGRAVNRRVGFFLARDFEMLEDGVRRQSYHLLLARPSDYPARAMRDNGYQLVTTTRGDGYIRFIVPKDSPLKSIKEISGKRIAFPEDISYAARVATATLRDNGIDIVREKAIKYYRDQAAIGFVLEAGLADVGAVMSYSAVAREWEKKGGRVLLDGPRQPYMPLVASPRVTAQEIAQIRATLIAMDQTAAGAAVLKRMGVTGFEQREPRDLLRLLQWLEK